MDKKKYLKTLLRHIIVWTLAFAFWTVMRTYGHEVVRAFEPFPLLTQLRFQLAIGITAGIIFGSLDFVLQAKVFRNISFGKALVIGTVGYVIAFFLFTALGINIFSRLMGIENSREVYKEFMFSKEMILVGFYCFAVGFAIDLFREIDKKMGPGNLWKMLRGEFYKPKEDERIFMFLDLKSSTTIAEKLGHIKYSKLIQDCFHDLDVVAKYNAEVYQYVGDEAVLTWDKEIGLINSNCLRAFFAFKERLASRSDYYQDNYGVVPEFKAGLNIGKIIVAEVGQIKTEIAYHGDTINTASRIQDQCNALGKSLLISEALKEQLNSDQPFCSAHVGDILLKGKRSKVNIYSVEVQ